MFQSLSGKQQRSLEIAGWILYNLKTILIEEHIIIPAIRYLIAGRKLLDLSTAQVLALSQLQMEEVFHTMLSHLAISQYDDFKTYLREFSDKDIDICNLYAKLLDLYPDHEEDCLIILSIVAESALSKYLSTIPDNENILMLHRKIIQIHREDEAWHSNPLQDTFFQDYFMLMNNNARKEVLKIFDSAISLFSKMNDNHYWELICKQVGIERVALSYVLSEEMYCYSSVLRYKDSLLGSLK